MNTPDSALITSRGGFQEAVRTALAEAASVGCREMWWLDANFADWPLSEPALIEQLTAWVQPHRRILMLAAEFDTLVRRHPRWVQWRRTWQHVTDCRVNDELDAGEVPTLLLAQPVVGVRLADPLRFRGRLTRDVPDLLRWRDEVDAILQRSTPSFPPTVLGL